MVKALSRWKQRIERIEQRMSIGTKRGPQLVYLMPCLESEEPEETSSSIKLSGGIWAEAFGAPFTSEQIAALKAEYGGLTPEQS